MAERVSSVCLAVEYKFMPRYCSMYTCSKLSSIEHGKCCNRQTQAAAMYIYLFIFYYAPCVNAFSAHIFSSPTATSLQCFAKAGKMEPNHLFNGFGPLQPAVGLH